MRFIGREQELQALENMYHSEGFQMLVLYGRRRIGKTTLLNRFSEGKNPLFYTGIESKDGENLRQFSAAVFRYFNPGAIPAQFSSFSDVLAYLTLCINRAGQKQRHLVILDEYPYMAAGARELSSLLQREIDHHWKDCNLMLVLCGSSVSFMEEEVLGEKSPLYGRRTGQMDLLPLDARTSALFVENYTPEEKAIVYGITGGIPKYLAEINAERSLEDNIIDKFFRPSGYFYEEPKNLLRQEFRDISLYFSILNAIGDGCTQVNEIAGRTGFDSAKLAQALRRLEAVRIVQKEIPILNEKNRKLTQYALRDGMFRFWFRFVSRGTAAIERGFGPEYCRTMVMPHIHEYMGGIFETICQEYVFRQGWTGGLGLLLNRVGKWRGNDSMRKCPADVDVVGINDEEKTAVIGECKFRNAPFGKEELETLLDRVRLVAPYRVVHVLIFSLSGVTRWVEEQEGPLIRIVPVAQLFQ